MSRPITYEVVLVISITREPIMVMTRSRLINIIAVKLPTEFSNSEEANYIVHSLIGPDCDMKLKLL